MTYEKGFSDQFFEYDIYFGSILTHTISVPLEFGEQTVLRHIFIFYSTSSRLNNIIHIFITAFHMNAFTSEGLTHTAQDK